MKKKALALILALVMVLSLAACGTQAETPATEPTEAPGKRPPSSPLSPKPRRITPGYTIRIYSNSNSTERTTWLVNEAKEAGFTISIDDNSVISGDTAAIQAANEKKDGDILFGLNETRWGQVVDGVYENLSSLTGLRPGRKKSANTSMTARPTASSSRTSSCSTVPTSSAPTAKSCTLRTGPTSLTAATPGTARTRSAARPTPTSTPPCSTPSPIPPLRRRHLRRWLEDSVEVLRRGQVRRRRLEVRL